MRRMFSLPLIRFVLTRPVLRFSARHRGFTMVEILIALSIVGILTAIAVPAYGRYIARGKTVQALADMRNMEGAFAQYYSDQRKYPPGDTGLALIGWTTKDPWGNDYQYLSMEGASVGKKRKDRSLHPLNGDYDLYSMGPDGESVSPLTAKKSQDDIIRANNGAFLGVASDY